jgi:acylphosphatase
MDADRIVRLTITGLVQGVGYRAFVEGEAQRLGIAGWVCNRRDRSVEALVKGPSDAIGELLVRLRRGPPGAQVDAIALAEAPADALDERRPGAAFSVLPTI